MATVVTKTTSVLWPSSWQRYFIYIRTSIVPTTEGQEESGVSAGVAAGVVVGLVLAVVVVVVAVVLAVVCSTQ